MDQPDLFTGDPPEDTSDGDTRLCKACQTEKPLEAFGCAAYRKDGTTIYKWSCSSCEGYMGRLRKQLRKEHKPPEDSRCQVCNKQATPLLLDHDHQTDLFRGYLCNACNLGIGNFLDDPTLLRAAIHYLEKSNVRD